MACAECRHSGQRAPSDEDLAATPARDNLAHDERSPEQLDMLPVLKSQYSVLLAMLLFSEAVLSWKSLCVWKGERQSVAAEATQEQPGALEERAISLGHLQPLSSAAAVITLVGATKKCVSDHKDARMPVGSAPWD